MSLTVDDSLSLTCPFEMIGKHRSYMERVVMKLGASRADAEDAVSHAGIKVSAKWHTIPSGARLSYYHRACINTWRDTISLHEKRCAGLEYASKAQMSQAEYSEIEIQQWVRQMFPRKRDRRVIYMKASGMENNEIAAKLGRSLQSIRAQLQRIRNEARCNAHQFCSN